MSRDTCTALVIEDDPAIRCMLVSALSTSGYQVHEADCAELGERLAANRRIDVFLIDLGLPDRDGLDLIRGLRRWTQRPIIVLSGRTQEQEKVEALDCGADDYLIKPFGIAELHARLRVALRHAAQTHQSGQTSLRMGPVTIDLGSKTVTRDGEAIRLTGTQWRLLALLAKHANRVVTTRQLLQEVWGPGQAEHAHYLRVYIHQLRRRLEPGDGPPTRLLTETGVGYRLVVDD